MLPNIVLASASPARLKLLQSAGIFPTIRVSRVNEESAVQSNNWTRPSEIALGLSILKAEDIVNSNIDTPSIVIGCDSVMEQFGVPLGKPENSEIAKQRLIELSGSFGTLHTGHCVIYCSGKENIVISRVVSTDVYFHELSAAEIKAYINTGEPLRVAGSFTLDALGAPFIKSISGDPSNVVGLSLATLRLMFQELGFAWEDVLNKVTVE